jgi:hypothetical protein
MSIDIINPDAVLFEVWSGPDERFVITCRPCLQNGDKIDTEFDKDGLRGSDSCHRCNKILGPGLINFAPLTLDQHLRVMRVAILLAATEGQPLKWGLREVFYDLGTGTPTVLLDGLP